MFTLNQQQTSGKAGYTFTGALEVKLPGEMLPAGERRQAHINYINKIQRRF